MFYLKIKNPFNLFPFHITSPSPKFLPPAQPATYRELSMLNKECAGDGGEKSKEEDAAGHTFVYVAFNGLRLRCFL
jgi:hypothetical protein